MASGSASLVSRRQDFLDRNRRPPFARARLMRAIVAPVSPRMRESIPTSRAMGTPRRVMVMDSPCSTDLSNSGRRAFASYKPMVCMVFLCQISRPVHLPGGPEHNRNPQMSQASLELFSRRRRLDAATASFRPGRRASGPATTDAPARPRSRSGRGGIRRVPPSRVECLARPPRPRGWRRSRPCRCVPSRGG